MTDVSDLFWYGLRFGRLGSASDLVVAAPLAASDPDVGAHTDPDRIGWYYDRTVGAEKIGWVIMGSESLALYDDRLEVLGDEVWHAGNLPTPQDKSEKGVASGYAELDATGKVPLAQLPASVAGGLAFQGMWDADANSPSLASGVGTEGDFYIVDTAGTTTLDGISDWQVGDWAVFADSVWNKVDNSESYLVKASSTDATPGFLDAKVDGVSIVVSGDQLQVDPAGASINADGLVVDASGFSGVLSASDTDGQTALDTLDAHSHALDDLTDIVRVDTIALVNATAVTVDSVAADVARWLLYITDGAGGSVALEVLACETGANTVDYTLLPGTSIFSHTVTCVRSAGTTSLRVSADGAGYTATARRQSL